MTSVRYLLTDSRYAGRAYALTAPRQRVKGAVTRTGKPKDQRVPLPPDQWMALPNGTAPPLVSESELAAVAARLTANRAQSRRCALAPEDFLLRAGFVRCGSRGRAIGAVASASDRFAVPE